MKKKIIKHLVKFLILIYFILIIDYIMDNKKEKEEKEKEKEQTRTEGEYLEICDHFKNIVEEKDKEVLSLKRETLRTKKLISKFYGLARSADEYMDICLPGLQDDFLDKLINMIRSDCSDFLFDKEEREIGLIEDEDVQFTINILDQF